MKIKTVIAINIATGLSIGSIANLVYGQQSANIGSIVVNDKATTIKERDRKGADDQYDKDESNIYISKEEIDRYKGTNPADTINHAVGVYSGDARNSGAIDPNVRGIQGQGRVPVTVDGTEQAITVWRGYNGANNRNYIDPNMISSIKVMKSATLDRNVRTSTGGGVAITTLGIDDVVDKYSKFGFDIKLETSSNSTKPRVNQLSHGIDYRDDKRLLNTLDMQKFRGIYFKDHEMLVDPRSKGNANFFNLQDNAARIAIGTRQEKFDLMLAYSYRNQGNYFAGRRGAGKFYDDIITYDPNSPNKAIDPYMPFVARIYGPNKEVANTSNEMSTLLAKLNVMLPNSQDLSLGYMHTSSHYGEIMPSQIRYHDLEGKIPQWPLANLALNTFYANYSFKPESIGWIDFRLGYWLTKTDLNSNTAGGQPREPMERDWNYEFGRDKNVAKNPAINGTLVDGIKLNQLNDRYGVSLSNKFQITPEFKVTLMGSLIDETIGSREDIFNSDSSPKGNMFRAIPREGKRREYNGTIRFDWQPTDWLSLNAGAQYISYWSRDLLKERRIAAKDINYAPYSHITARNFRLSRVLSEKEYQVIQEYVDDKGKTFKDTAERPYERRIFIEKALNMKADSLMYARYRMDVNRKNSEFRITERNNIVKWKVDENNRFIRKNNPFYNGEIDLKEEIIDPVTGLKAKKYRKADITNNGYDEVKYSNKQKFKSPKRNEESAWAPALGATIYLTENDRIFGRYLETVRMPSIFEDTIGFSGGREPNYTPPVYLPERSHTIELGYVRNFQGLVAAENHADLRINYYNTVVTNAFDRNDRLVFTQVDKHNTAGLELLARYDNGWVFGDLGVDYRLKNEVCDEVSLMVMDPYNKFGGSECTTAGFPGGYLRTQLQPKYSIHANLGLRFLDERLEVGSRLRYHSKAKNEDEAEMMDKYPYQYAPLNNDPMSWNAVFTADAYVNYQFNKDLAFELLATNLFDEYYIDPLTRSMMPAPGRTVRFNITSRF
ncbi:TonB-dependent receptor domain-containing protein [Providencia sp. PROV201]|uniref:TonB-dependent receptor domain-containing protein n=1 Tax=Providencia sp. PROV201 TaxID=2949901 RepID=UPI00234BB7C7|nr:TonB-dependent receptor [Providencia sp. PROV201]